MLLASVHISLDQRDVRARCGDYVGFRLRPRLIPLGDLSLNGSTKGLDKVWDKVAVSPDGKIIASGAHDHCVYLADAATGKELRPPAGHAHQVCDVTYSADGKWLVTASMDHTLVVWDAATDKEVHRLKGHGRTVRALALAARLSGMVRVLRVLELLDRLENLVPAPTASPVEQLRLAKRRRQRASGKRAAAKTTASTWTWGDES